MPNQSGNGKNVPFGNGAGKGGSNAMPNDFTKNQRGTGGGSKPRDFVGQQRTQPKADQERGVGSIETGPLKADPSGGPSSHDVGTTANGAKNVPFRVGGG